jgi:hypothetical protein
VCHPIGCGLCRVGGREKYFHCDKCVACLPLSMRDNHKCLDEVSPALLVSSRWNTSSFCVERLPMFMCHDYAVIPQSLHANCPVCLEFMHSSLRSATIMVRSHDCSDSTSFVTWYLDVCTNLVACCWATDLRACDPFALPEAAPQEFGPAVPNLQCLICRDGGPLASNGSGPAICSPIWLADHNPGCPPPALKATICRIS